MTTRSSGTILFAALSFIIIWVLAVGAFGSSGLFAGWLPALLAAGLIYGIGGRNAVMLAVTIPILLILAYLFHII